jgi:hypothetical protein
VNTRNTHLISFLAIDFEVATFKRDRAASFVVSALPSRLRAIASGSIGRIMQDLLQQLDLDYYRSALMFVARAERLLQEHLAGIKVERLIKTPFGTAPTADRHPHQSGSCKSR